MARRSDDLLSIFDAKREEKRSKRASPRKASAAGTKRGGGKRTGGNRGFQGLYLTKRQALLAASAAALLLLLTFTLGLALGRPGGDEGASATSMRRESVREAVMMRIRIKRENPITQRRVSARQAVKLLVERHQIPRKALIRAVTNEHVILVDLGPFRDEAQIDAWISSLGLAQTEIMLEAPFHQREVLPYEPRQH